MVLEMDMRPLGDTVIQGLAGGADEWPEARACWDAKCANPQCDRVLYDKALTLSTIKQGIEELPSTV